MSVKVDEELASLIPPLSAEEAELLEASIVFDGRVRDPLVVWREEGILIDGHNRHRIATKHGLKFETVDVSFRSRDEVAAWMLANQLGRRNLTDDQRAAVAMELMEKRTAVSKADRTARATAARKGDGSVVDNGSTTGLGGQEDNVVDNGSTTLRDPPRVREQVAAEAKVPVRKVRAVAAIAKAKPELVKEIAAGKKTIRQATKEAGTGRSAPKVTPASVEPPAETHEPEEHDAGDVLPWHEFDRAADAWLKDLDKLIRSAPDVFGVNKDRNKQGKWSHYLSWEGVVGGLRQVRQHIEGGRPAAESDKAPGYLSADAYKLRESVRRGKAGAA